MTARLDAEALGRLECLVLQVLTGMGERPGERRVPGRPQASGIEVEGHVAYSPGDDLRHLDWNVVGRLDTLLVRRFVAEREVVFHLLLDASASMDVPRADRKLAHARELVMALVFVALSANDAVRIALLRGEAPVQLSPVYRQRAAALRAAAFLAGAVADGALALGAALETYARRNPRPGAAIVVSDLAGEPSELERGIGALRARGWEVLLLQVLGAEERDPRTDTSGAVLRDVETGATHPLRLDRETCARYRVLLAEHLAALATLAGRAGAVYARFDAPGDASAFVRGELARLGVVRRR